MPNLRLLFAAIAEHTVDGLLGERARRELVGQSAIERYDIDKAIEAVNNRFNNETDKKLAGILSNRLLDDNLLSQDDVRAFLENPDPRNLEKLIVDALETEHGTREITANQRADFAHKYVEALLVELTSVNRETSDRINVGYHQSHDRKLDDIGVDIRAIRDDFERIPSQFSPAKKLDYVHYDPPPPPDPTTIPEPADLPPGSRLELGRNATFVGREDELRQLADLLLYHPTGDAAIITTGYGGAGKTQLAIEFAFRYGRYFRGVHWISAIQRLKTESDDQIASSDPFANDIVTCGRAMGLELPNDLAEAAQLTRQAWAESPTRLVILDNVENEAQLSNWQGQFPAMRLLVTSRWTKWSRNLNVKAMPLDVLPPDRAIELLRQLAPRLADVPDAELDKIGQKLGYLPLALDLVGRYLDLETDLSPADYLVAVEEKGAALSHEALKDYFGEDDYSPTNQKRNVIACFELSWDQLKREEGEWKVNFLARKVLRGCSYCAPNAPIPLELLERAFEDEEDENAPSVRQALKRLFELGMLRPAGEGEVGPTIHLLMAEFGRMEDQEVGASVLGVMADALAILSNRANETGLPQHFEMWRKHMVPVAEWAEIAGNPTSARVWNNLARHIRKLADLTMAKDYMLHALAIDEEKFGKNDPKVATRLSNLGGILKDLGNLEEAKVAYERALAIDEEAFGANHPKVAIRLNNLGTVLRRLGDLEAAKAAYERALAIDKEAFGANHPKVATRLNNLGYLLRRLGDLMGTKAAYEQALSIDETAYGKSHPKVAIRVINLGTVFQELGDLQLAKSAFERALNIRQQYYPTGHSKIASVEEKLYFVNLQMDA